MKKLLAVFVGAAAFMPMQAMAADTASGQIVGVVSPVCETTDVFSTMSFSSLTTGQTASDNFQIRCNDADGATLTLTSAQGGLKNDDSNAEIEYTAVVTGTGAVTGTLATLTLPTGNDADTDVSATGTLAGSNALASGAGATLAVTLSETATFAGGYSDTITIQLTAS